MLRQQWTEGPDGLRFRALGPVFEARVYRRTRGSWLGFIVSTACLLLVMVGVITQIRKDGLGDGLLYLALSLVWLGPFMWAFCAPAAATPIPLAQKTSRRASSHAASANP